MNDFECSVLFANLSKIEIIVFLFIVIVIYYFQLRRWRLGSLISIIVGALLIIIDALYAKELNQLSQNLIFAGGAWLGLSGFFELMLVSFSKKEKLARKLAVQPIARLHMDEVGNYLLNEVKYPISNPQLPKSIEDDNFRNTNQQNFAQYIELEILGNTVLYKLYADAYKEFTNNFLMTIYEAHNKPTTIKFPSAIAVQLRNKFDAEHSKQYNTSIYDFETFYAKFSNITGSNSNNESKRIFIIKDYKNLDKRCKAFQNVKSLHKKNNEIMYCIDYDISQGIKSKFGKVGGLDFSINFNENTPEVLIVNNSLESVPLACPILFPETIESYELLIYFKNQQEKINEYNSFFQELEKKSDLIDISSCN